MLLRGRPIRLSLALAGLIAGLLVGVVPAAATTTAATRPALVCSASYRTAERTHHPKKATHKTIAWGKYPCAHARANTVDGRGMSARQCTSYVAWALSALGVDFGRNAIGPNGKRVLFGDATTWAAQARKGGWKVSSAPVVGAVAQWRADETSIWTQALPGGLVQTSYFQAGSVGHVAIVTAVLPHGLVRVSQYNATKPLGYSTEILKAPRYLYIGVH